jgi:hypothetical protein
LSYTQQRKPYELLSSLVILSKASSMHELYCQSLHCQHVAASRTPLVALSSSRYVAWNCLSAAAQMKVSFQKCC